jgi:hypothetical protein
LVVDIATGEASDEVESQELTEAQKFARSGGKVGGAARARALSPERRAEIAKKAAKTRWKRGS